MVLPERRRCLTRGLAVARGWFGLGRTRWIEAAEVEKLEAAGKIRSGSYTWYDLVVECHDGKRITAAKRLPSKRLAMSILGQLQQAMGGRRSWGPAGPDSHP